MKKVWRCPHCKQMSSRLANLKRHFNRKHNGMVGKPILQYISGNSIVTPEETPSSLQVFHDEYAMKQRQPAFRDSNSFHIKDTIDWLDEWFNKYTEPVLKLMEIRARINPMNQSMNANPLAYFSQVDGYPYQSFHSTPTYLGVDSNSEAQPKIPRNYDGVSGFKADICLKCLTTGTAAIGPKSFSIQDVHRCNSEWEDWVKKLEPREYAINLIDKVYNLPRLLLQECKEWANNTSQQLYLVATKIESPVMNESHKGNAQSNYAELSFLNKLLAQSKIMPNDTELFEFLKFAINQTKTVITLSDKTGQSSSKFMLAVSNV